MKILGYKVTNSDVKRFESYIDKTDSGCWLWTGGKNTWGYAYFGLHHGMSLRAHRFSYEVYIGEIPFNLQLDHLCRVRHCVNPRHLEPVTQLENHRRGYWASRKECSNGHLYSCDNTYYSKSGARRCKACSRISSLESYHKRKNK